MHRGSGCDLAALASVPFCSLSSCCPSWQRHSWGYTSVEVSLVVCLDDRNYQKAHILPVLQLLLSHRNGRKALAGVSAIDSLSLWKLLFFWKRRMIARASLLVRIATMSIHSRMSNHWTRKKALSFEVLLKCIVPKHFARIAGNVEWSYRFWQFSRRLLPVWGTDGGIWRSQSSMVFLFLS